MFLNMPGRSFRGPLPELNERELHYRSFLRRQVEVIAGDIGERHSFLKPKLDATAEHLLSAFRRMNLEPRELGYRVGGATYYNLEVEIPGDSLAHEVVVIGAHYDSAMGTPGANDNATGVAALLALAETFSDSQPQRTLRFVAFVNEEPDFFKSPLMGSLVYARECRERNESVLAMLSLETLGFYSDEPGSQKYPLRLLNLFYPSRANFLAFVADSRNRHLVRHSVSVFREGARLPSTGIAAPSWVQGVDWSDHWSFWQQGYPAIMVTDTAPLRYDLYHKAEDTPDRIDYDRLARAVFGLERVVDSLSNPKVLEK